ncbi:MAG: tRNA dihydrouridine synthase DusB [Candidatus Margulisbacteria bacterium]|nr:tRNA dihydrouridine synthase DusB [Candidatus Margulisiibacteriota bacterium]
MLDKVILAPIAGVADLAFRLICREHGAGLCFYEMLDSNSLIHGPKRKIEDIIQFHKKDTPIAGQLLGNDPDNMLKAAKKLLKYCGHIKFLDINAACPVKKVLKKKAGAHLLKEPETLYRVIDKLANNLPLNITVKLRVNENITQIARGCENAGAKVLFVHGRTAQQLYKGNVDHRAIKSVKDAVKIPVYASGNIFSPQAAKEALDLTGCDGVLIARGSFGNPWIFKRTKHYLKTGKLLAEPGWAEKLTTIRRHVQYIEKNKKMITRINLACARKTAIWYLKSFKNSRAVRDEAGKKHTFKELYALIDSISESLLTGRPTTLS